MLAQYETQLKYRRLDENGDVMFGGGESDFLTGREAMEQVIKTRLGSAENEWWEGDDTALPWYTEMIGTMNTPDKVEELDLLVIGRIMDTIGVISVKDIQSSIENRHYHFTCKVQTIYGEVNAEVNT